MLIHFNEHEFCMNFTPVHMHTHIRVQKCLFFTQRASRQNSQQKLTGKFQVQTEWNSHVMSCSLLVVQPSPLLLFPDSLSLSLTHFQTSLFPFLSYSLLSRVSFWLVCVRQCGEYFCLLPSPCHIPASRAQRPPAMGYKEKHSSSMHLHSAIWPPFAFSEFFELFWIDRLSRRVYLPTFCSLL